MKKKKKKKTAAFSRAQAVVFKVDPFCICLHLSHFIYMLICEFSYWFNLLFVILCCKGFIFVTAVYIDFVKSCGVFKRCFQEVTRLSFKV